MCPCAQWGEAAACCSTAQAVLHSQSKAARIQSSHAKWKQIFSLLLLRILHIFQNITVLKCIRMYQNGQNVSRHPPRTLTGHILSWKLWAMSTLCALPSTLQTWLYGSNSNLLALTQKEVKQKRKKKRGKRNISHTWPQPHNTMTYYVLQTHSICIFYATDNSNNSYTCIFINL